MVNFYTYLELFLEDLHKPVYLAEFEKHFKKPHQTIKNHLDKFVKNNILTMEKKERLLFYKINLENPLTKEYIMMCEKERLIRFLQNTLFKQLYKKLTPYFKNSKILIFGSSVKTTNFEDIDILIVTNSKIKGLKEFEQTYSKKIHLITTTEITRTLLKEIKNKHIIINNHEYFVEVLYDEFKLVQETRDENNTTK